MENPKFTAKISRQGATIVSEVNFQDGVGRTEALMHQMVNTQEPNVRKALMDMGWTPPNRNSVDALLDAVYKRGIELPKCDDEIYENGFLDGLNYFVQEMKVKIKTQ